MGRKRYLLLSNFLNVMIFSTFMGSELTDAKIFAYRKMCKFLQKSEKITAKWGKASDHIILLKTKVEEKV